MEQYEGENRGELERLVSHGREVQCAVKKREFSVQCAEIYAELMGAEEVLRWRLLQQQQQQSSDKSSGKNKKIEEGRRAGYENVLEDEEEDDDWSEDETEEGKKFIRCVQRFIFHVMQSVILTSSHTFCTQPNPIHKQNIDTTKQPFRI